MVKYTIEYNDIEEVTHSISIDDPSFSGSGTFVNGRAFMSYSTTDDVLEPIRGAGLKIEMDADQEMDFSDLYNELERTFKVIYTRDGVIEFQGFLNSEGYFESFVEDRWVVSFDVVDGLGFLKDLAFVDSDGLPFLGKMSHKDVLTNALARCGITKTINDTINIKYVGLSNFDNTLENVYVLADRYKKDDKEQTIMSCEEVIKDILDSYTAVLISKGEEWRILRPNFLETFTPSITLGSEINGFYPHHCNANQTISFKGSLGAYRISYKYGERQSFIDNPVFESLDGSTIEGWTIVDDTYLEPLAANGTGLKYSVDKNVPFVANNPSLSLNPIELAQGVSTKFALQWRAPESTIVGFELKFYLSVGNATDGFYYLTRDGDSIVWSPTTAFLTFPIGTFGYVLPLLPPFDVPPTPSGGTIEFEIPPTPAGGDLNFRIYTPLGGDFGGSDFFPIYVDSAYLTYGGASNLAVQGETYTFERITNPNAKVDAIKEVLSGDNPTNTFNGTLYKNDQETPTSTWQTSTDFATQSFPLIELMGREIMRMNKLPSRLFTGDIYGVIPYDRLIAIDGINDKDGNPCKFMFIQWDYDTRENVISAELRQIYSGAIGGESTDGTDADILFTLGLDYGNVVEPTIRG